MEESMKALLLWYPHNPHPDEIQAENGYTSQDACLSHEFTDEEKDRISEVLALCQDVPELLTY
jgi:hypothetical protein